MVRSSEPSMIVRRWLSIFSRADWSMRASCISSASIILRTPRRIVLRSSMNSTSSRSATASVTTWASLLTLSGLNRTAGASSKSFSSFSKNSLVFFCQLGLYLAKHFLVIGAALLHFVGIGFENDADLIVNTVFERQFFEQRGVYLLGQTSHSLGLYSTAPPHFFRDFPAQIP